MEQHDTPAAQPTENPGAAPALPLELHASAAIFPPLRDSEFAALVADIREHGQLEPIWTYQGKVIDGRHRLRACTQLGLTPRTREWDGNGSLLAFIVSANLRRRHLKENQRAMIAARMLPQFEAEALKRKQAAAKGEDVPNWVQGRSVVHAGEVLNVSKNSVARARKLLDSGIPELIARVDSGELAVSLAAKVAELPAKEQLEFMQLNRKEIAATLKMWEQMAAPPPPAEPQPTAVAQPEEEQKIAQMIEHTQLGPGTQLLNTPQGLRLELTYADCLTEFYRLNSDRYHLLDLLDRGVFIVRRKQQAS